MKAATKAVFDNPDLSGKKVAIQGIGNIGSVLAKYLVDAGATVIISDVNEDAVKELSKETTS